MASLLKIDKVVVKRRAVADSVAMMVIDRGVLEVQKHEHAITNGTTAVSYCIALRGIRGEQHLVGGSIVLPLRLIESMRKAIVGASGSAVLHKGKTEIKMKAPVEASRETEVFVIMMDKQDHAHFHNLLLAITRFR